MQGKKRFWTTKTVMLTLILILAVVSAVKAAQLIMSNTITVPVAEYHLTLYSNYTSGTLTLNDFIVFNATLVQGSLPVTGVTVKLYMNDTEINTAPTDSIGQALFPGYYLLDQVGTYNFTATYQTP